MAEKTQQSQCEAIPQQSYYDNVWSEPSNKGATPRKDKNFLKTFYHFLTQLPFVEKRISALAYRFYAWQTIPWKRIP